jgi:hypothetical protein
MEKIMAVPDREPKKPKAKYEQQTVEGKPELVFYAPEMTMQTFYIPVIDAEGKPVASRNRDNTQKFLNGVPMYQEKIVKFDVMSKGTRQNPDKTLCTYTLKSDDPQYEDKLKELTRLCKDETSPVMDQMQFDKYTNRTAAKYKYENEALRKQTVEQENVIKEMEKRIAELTGGKKE